MRKIACLAAAYVSVCAAEQNASSTNWRWWPVPGDVDPSGELETCGLDWRRQGAALVRAVHVRVAGWISEARSRTARREAEADAALLDPRAEREEEVEMT
eukprot:Polyplicarium_translucidae@DN3096_c0_g2_i1.p3